MKQTTLLTLGFLIVAQSAASAQEFRVELFSRPPLKTSPAHAPRPARTAGRLQPLLTVTVNLDSYLEGVLAGEASILKSREALEAMAVVARTWALRYRGRHQAAGYDFCSLTHCQVFRIPEDLKYPAGIVEAVLKTRGKVLQYRGQLADPYFSADCGGVTESAGDVWPDRNNPYLRSVSDPYCAASVHSKWRQAIPQKTAASILREDQGLPIRGPVRELAIESRDSSGRARRLRVTAGQTWLVDANAFRYAVDRRLGWNTLKSNLYEVHLQGDVLIFAGRGLGHGVGLCQAGADQMGQMGASYENILARYFPGTTVATLPSPAHQDADPVVSSEHFELAYPESQQQWVNEVLSTLERCRKELDLNVADLPARVHVQTWDTAAEFIRATGEPGWAAGSTDGKAIFLQPLRTLAAKGILDQTLRHEFAHVAVHRLRAAGVPDWFEEGVVLYLTGERIADDRDALPSARSLSQAISRAQSEAETHAAYARTYALVRDLAARRGQDALWRTLERPTPQDLKWLKTESAKPLAPSRTNP